MVSLENKNKGKPRKVKISLRGTNPKPLFLGHDSIATSEITIHEVIFREMEYKKTGTQKRILPFLLTIFSLVLFISYSILAVNEQVWIQLILFSFLFVNLLLINFALWNYFEGKNILRIWCIELLLVVLIMCFIL